MTTFLHQTFMHEALLEAQKALTLGHLPVGAVMVHEGKIIARAHKTMGSNHLEHAETNLMRDVFRGDYHFNRTELILYSTLEPCLMCYGTMRHCPVGHLVYALEDPYGGAAHMVDSALPQRHHSRPMHVTAGVMRSQSLLLFREFLDTTNEPFWVDGGAKEFQDLVRAVD